MKNDYIIFFNLLFEKKTMLSIMIYTILSMLFYSLPYVLFIVYMKNKFDV